jgi:hypothetical protein
MARTWSGLCPAVDCGGLMMMMMTSPFLSGMLYKATKGPTALTREIDCDQTAMAFNTADVTDGIPIAIRSRLISGLSANNLLVAFYNIHGRKRVAIFFSSVPDTTCDHVPKAYKDIVYNVEI